jgi:hypothetical protein
MTRKQQAKIRLAQVERAIENAVNAGAQSASLSTGVGSEAYTNFSLSDLMDMRSRLRSEVAAYESAGRARITVSGVKFG